MAHVSGMARVLARAEKFWERVISESLLIKLELNAVDRGGGCALNVKSAVACLKQNGVPHWP